MNNLKFRFNFVSLEQTLDEINELNPKRAYQTTLSKKSISDYFIQKKASQTADILVPIIKRKKDDLILFIYHNLNNSLEMV